MSLRAPKFLHCAMSPLPLQFKFIHLPFGSICEYSLYLVAVPSILSWAEDLSQWKPEHSLYQLLKLL